MNLITADPAHRDSTQAELFAELREEEAPLTDPERFVSERDYDAATDADYADLDRVLDWEQHSWTL